MMKQYLENRYTLLITIATAFLVAKMRLPKVLAEEIKLLMHLVDLPKDTVNKIVAGVDYISSDKFGRGAMSTRQTT